MITLAVAALGAEAALGHESVKASRGVRRAVNALKVNVSANFTKVTFTIWDTDETCSGTAEYSETTAIGTCSPWGDGTATMNTGCDTKVHFQNYLDEACTKVDGNAGTLDLSCSDYGAGYGSGIYTCS